MTVRTFGTRGPVTPEKHYIVARTAELADFLRRVKEGRYLVIFAPRQTGKTTFFRRALQVLAWCKNLPLPQHDACFLSWRKAFGKRGLCKDIPLR